MDAVSSEDGEVAEASFMEWVSKYPCQVVLNKDTVIDSQDSNNKTKADK